MTNAKIPGKGKMSAEIEVVKAKDAKPIPEAPKKTGIETVREKYQHDEESPEMQLVRVIDHDANRVLYSGSAADFKALQKHLGEG